MEINEKNLETIFKTKGDEIKRHFDVVAEDLRSDIKLIAEHQSVIIEKLDSHAEKLDSHDQKFTSISQKLDSHDQKFISISQKLDSHDQKFTSISQKLDSHTEMIGEVMINIERIKIDVEFIKSSLKKKVDTEEFETLEKRVAFLESKIISNK